MTMINDLSPQWFCANSYTWVHDVQLHVIGTNELSKPSKERIISSHNWFTIRRVLKSHGSKMSVIYTCNHEKQCVTVRHIPACMSCHTTIVVIIGRAHCFRDYMYILCPSCFLHICMYVYIIYIILYILCIYINIYGIVAIESWSEWDLNSQPLISV